MVSGVTRSTSLLIRRRAQLQRRVQATFLAETAVPPTTSSLRAVHLARVPHLAAAPRNLPGLPEHALLPEDNPASGPGSPQARSADIATAARECRRMLTWMPLRSCGRRWLSARAIFTIISDL